MTIYAKVILPLAYTIRLSDLRLSPVPTNSLARVATSSSRPNRTLLPQQGHIVPRIYGEHHPPPHLETCYLFLLQSSSSTLPQPHPLVEASR